MKTSELVIFAHAVKAICRQWVLGWNPQTKKAQPEVCNLIMLITLSQSMSEHVTQQQYGRVKKLDIGIVVHHSSDRALLPWMEEQS